MKKGIPDKFTGKTIKKWNDAYFFYRG